MQLEKSIYPSFQKAGAPDFWPVHWITHVGDMAGSRVIAYKLEFTLPVDGIVRIHVSADQRYRLFLDGVREGEGPCRCDDRVWYFDSYDLELRAGEHTIVALVWWLEPSQGIMPAAQITRREAFLMAVDDPHGNLSTGRGNWTSRPLDGIEFHENSLVGTGSLSGATLHLDGARFPWEVTTGAGEGWTPVSILEKAQTCPMNLGWGCLDTPLLAPNPLPPQRSARVPLNRLRHVGEHAAGDSRFKVNSVDKAQESDSLAHLAEQNQALTILPNTCRWMLFDLDGYYCGFTELMVSGGAGTRIRVIWAEALFNDNPTPQPGTDPDKGHRDVIEDKSFWGKGDTFLVGNHSQPLLYTPFWWNSGRYIAIVVETGDEALRMESISVRETRYPLEQKAVIETDHPTLSQAAPMMWRTLQMCAHETYMDCPYYEQLNYAGDTRIQALVTYVLSSDHRLPRKCIEHFANSLLPSGLTQARAPCHFKQVIPQFSLYWIGMLYDYALWKGEPEWIRTLMPKVHCVLDTFLSHVGDDGLLRCPEGWDWVDWAKGWNDGSSVSHPKGPEGSSSVNHLQLIYILGLAVKLENWIGHAAIAGYYREQADTLWESAIDSFWCSKRRLFAETSELSSFGEHAQAFAILSDQCEASRGMDLCNGLIPGMELTRATGYFQFYKFAALARLGQFDQITNQLGDWQDMVNIGCRTTLERPDPSRSDCHAWSAHPLYHAAVSLCGISPADFRFESVRIRPALQSIKTANARIPHPKGMIEVAWTTGLDSTELHVNLPAGLAGELIWEASTLALEPGNSRMKCSPGSLPCHLAG